MGEKFTRLALVLNIFVWVFCAIIGLFMHLFNLKKEPSCPYRTVDGNSESIRALNYK